MAPASSAVPLPSGHSMTRSSAAASSAADDDPLAYQDQLDFNTRRFPQYSHVIECAPPLGSPERVIRLCRCWQSRKFPYCDDTHKVLVEAGDNVGPFVAKLRGSVEGDTRGRERMSLQQQVPVSHQRSACSDDRSPVHAHASALQPHALHPGVSTASAAELMARNLQLLLRQRGQSAETAAAAVAAHFPGSLPLSPAAAAADEAAAAAAHHAATRPRFCGFDFIARRSVTLSRSGGTRGAAAALLLGTAALGVVWSTFPAFHGRWQQWQETAHQGGEGGAAAAAEAPLFGASQAATATIAAASAGCQTVA